MTNNPSEKPDSTVCRPIWDRLGAWWDQAVAEGNEFQRELIMPATDRLLNLGNLSGRSVLDIGCGNGNYARRLGRAGALVTATDFSQGMLDRARLKTSARDGAIEYRLVDATDETAIRRLVDAADATDSRRLLDAADATAARRLGVGRFDAAVCSMAMMDMPTIDPLCRGLAAVLKPGGRFVFSLPHPCFNSNEPTMTAELIQSDGRLEQIYGLRIDRYAEPSARLSSGILNQPEPHYLFHRPLALVLASFFAAGFALDGLEEPTYPTDAGAKNPFAWKKRPAIPPAIVGRVRLTTPG